MGRAGRFACILLPMLATAAALAIIIVVMLGGTNKGSGVLTDIYFLRLDTRFIEAPDRLDLFKGIPGIDGIVNTTDFDNAVQSAAEELGLYDYYDISLFSYCAGNYYNDTGKWETEMCSKPSFTYWFNPLSVFGTTKEGQKNITFPQGVQDAVKPIQGASRAMTVAFAFAAVLTAVEFVVGWFGLLSRWGSCCTTIVAMIASTSYLVAAAIMTALFFAIAAAFNKALDDFGVEAIVNKRIVSLVWIGVAISLGAGFFWLLSTCCCSGRRDRVMGEGRHGKRTGVEKAPYTYERVASPYMGNSANTHHGAAIPLTHQPPQPQFEPMRHSQV